MALTDLDYIRLRLSIPHRLVLAEFLGQGDGITKKFQTQLSPIIAETETVRVDGTEKTQDTDYSIDNALGLITFKTAPDTDAAVDADYSWSVFSDVQINGLLARYSNNIIATLRELVRALLADSDLFIKYVIGMETVDRSAARAALEALLKDLKEQAASAAGQAIIWTKADIKETKRDVPWESFGLSEPHD